MQQWWHTAVELLHAGKRAEAVRVTRQAAAAGSLAAKVRLAVFGDDAGVSWEEGDRIIAEAERTVAEDDETTHWVLWGAYDLLHGHVEYEERSRLALRHLEAFARITGDPLATIALARNYAAGRIGVEPSVERAVEWYYYAAAVGHPDAERELRRLRYA